jgi:hypothetical protein
MYRRLTKDEVLEKFVEDPEVIEATRQWALRTQLAGERVGANEEFIDRLVYLLTRIDTDEVEVEDYYGDSGVA